MREVWTDGSSGATVPHDEIAKNAGSPNAPLAIGYLAIGDPASLREHPSLARSIFAPLAIGKLPALPSLEPGTPPGVPHFPHPVPQIFLQIIGLFHNFHIFS